MSDESDQNPNRDIEESTGNEDEPRGAGNGGPGKPPFSPTAAQRQIVSKAMAFGMTQDEARGFVFNPQTGRPINIKTLRHYFREELRIGKARMTMAIASNMARTALSKTHKDATRAGIFYLTHQAGWQARDERQVEQETKTAEEAAAEVRALLGAVDLSVGGVAASNGHGRMSETGAGAAHGGLNVNGHQNGSTNGRADGESGGT